MPFIHSLCSYKSSLIVGTETGHILCIPVYDLRKPKFILQASLCRIVCSRIWQKNKPILISADNADSFCLFDFEKRTNSQPTFLQKYKTIAEPVQIEPLGTNLLVATTNPALSIFSLKM